MLNIKIAGISLFLVIALLGPAAARDLALVRGGGGDSGGRTLATVPHLPRLDISRIHWCWGKTEEYNGWCHSTEWDGVSTGGEPKCSTTNPAKPACVPGTFLADPNDVCPQGAWAINYFFGFYGRFPVLDATLKQIVQAVCSCDWCAVFDAADTGAVVSQLASHQLGEENAALSAITTLYYCCVDPGRK